MLRFITSIKVRFSQIQVRQSDQSSDKFECQDQMQNGHGRESGGCVELGLETKENGLVQLSGGLDVQRGRLSWIPLKVLLYDDLVGVVTSHVTKMAVTPLAPQLPKPSVVPYANFTPLSSVAYVRSFFRLKFFHCVNREFRLIIAKSGRKCYFSFVPLN